VLNVKWIRKEEERYQGGSEKLNWFSRFRFQRLSSHNIAYFGPFSRHTRLLQPMSSEDQNVQRLPTPPDEADPQTSSSSTTSSVAQPSSNPQTSAPPSEAQLRLPATYRNQAENDLRQGNQSEVEASSSLSESPFRHRLSSFVLISCCYSSGYSGEMVE
jgi:hypothetical protein